MSRDYRDKPGGHAPGKWYLANGSRWVQFMKRQCQKNSRAKAKNALRHNAEPQPRYPVERVYLD